MLRLKNWAFLTGMVLADARAVIPDLQVFDDRPGLPEKLLSCLAEWCLRYSPVVATDMPSGLILDITGCAHLFGSERAYLKDITSRLRGSGYDQAAAADTIGAAWAILPLWKNHACDRARNPKAGTG